jgi:hypothetical protein
MSALQLVEKTSTHTLTHALYVFEHLLLKRLLTYSLSLCGASVYICGPTLLHDFESPGCTLPLVEVLKRLTETPCILCHTIYFENNRILF